MKAVNITKVVVPTFRPVTLELTFSTQAEVDNLYGILNTPYITQGASYFNQASTIRDALRPNTDIDKAHRVFEKLLHARENF